MEQKEKSKASIDMTRTTLDLFKMICEPARVTDITVGMVDRFDAERGRGVRRCTARSCRWPNTLEATHCWQCEAEPTCEPRKISVETRHKDLRTLRAALERGRKAYRLPVNVFDEVEWPETEETLPTPVADEDITELVSVVDEQWGLFIYLAVATGCRTGEILRLSWTDLDLDRGVCVARKTKGKKDRLAYLDNHAIALLRRLCDERRIVGRVEAPIFVRTDGRDPGTRWTQSYLNRTWPKLCKKAEIGEYTLHDMRASCGTNLAEAGVSEKLATEVSGHSTADVLRKYYQLARVEAARDAVTKATARLRARLGAGA